MWVGNFYPNKWNLMPKIIKDNPDVHFLLVFSSRKWQRPIWSKNVTTAFGVKRELMKDLYAVSDFHISTSPVEAFSLCQLESLFCNKPVIGFDTGFLKTSPHVDKYGIKVDKWNAESYTQAIKDLNVYLKPRNDAMCEFDYEKFKQGWRDVEKKYGSE